MFDDQGRLLLVQRGREPQLGRWSLPGGKANPGETFEDAAKREILEETGLSILLVRKLGVTTMPSVDDRIYEIHNFYARVEAGALTAGDDAAQARWVHLKELESFPLTTGLGEYLRRVGVIPTR